MGAEEEYSQRLWTGQQDNETVVGDGLVTASNVSFRYQGEARRRPGLYNRITLSATLLSELEHPVNGTYLIGASAGTITGVRISDGTSTSLSTGLNTALRGCFARSNGRVYFTNDFDSPLVIERGDAAAGTAGIAGPAGTMGAATQAAGNGTIGIHLLRYRYYNSKTGYYSDASLPVTETIASTTKKLTFTIAASGSDIDRSTDTKVDTIAIEMTEASGSTYYQAVTVLNAGVGSVDVDMSDATLRTKQPATYYGEDGHQPPPVTALMCEHRGRNFYWNPSEHAFSGVAVTNASATMTGTGLSPNWVGRLVQVGTDTAIYTITAINATTITVSPVYAGSTAASTNITIFSSQYDMLFWSRAGYPESTFPTRWARRVLQNKSDKPSAMASFYNDLYLFGQYSLRRFVYEKDPATALLENVPGTLGVYNQRCLVEASGRLFGFGRSGAWALDGIVPKHISRPVDQTVEGLIDRTYAEKFFGWWDPQERAVCFAYVRNGEEQVRDFFKLELDSGKWSLGKWRWPMTATCVTGSSTRVVQPYIADANGYVWNIKEGYFDGLPAAMTSGILTTTTGSSTTVINITPATLDIATGLQGAILYNPTTGEEKRISSNTASAITVATAFAIAPAAGVTLYVGSISVVLTSGWWTGDGMQAKKRPRYLRMAFVPGTTSGTFTVQVFRDFSSTPVTFTQFSGDLPPAGVTITNNGTSVTVTFSGSTTTPFTDGFVEIPLFADWSRALQWRITSATPVDTMKLVAAWFEVEDTRQTNAAEGE